MKRWSPPKWRITLRSTCHRLHPSSIAAYGLPAAEQGPGAGFRLRDRAIPVVEYYWQVVRNNRLLIAGILVGAIVLGVLATLLATPQYRANSRSNS